MAALAKSYSVSAWWVGANAVINTRMLLNNVAIPNVRLAQTRAVSTVAILHTMIYR